MVMTCYIFRLDEEAMVPMTHTETTSPQTAVSGTREVRAPRGTQLSCKSWQQEAALRMLMNNLDPDVAERPHDLVVYGGSGKAVRNWACFDAIVRNCVSWVMAPPSPRAHLGEGGVFLSDSVNFVA
jgi:hypothetical protein